MYKILSCLLIFSSTSLFSQLLPNPILKTSWQAAGSQTVAIDRPTLELASTNLIEADGTIEVEQLQAFLDEHTFVKILFPAGDFYLNGTISLPEGTALQGSGMGNTRLFFDTAGHGIEIRGALTDVATNLTQTLAKNAYECEVADGSLFMPNDWLKLSSQDDSLVFSVWAKGSTGQINQIERVEGNQLFFKFPFRRQHLLSDAPVLTKIEPIQKVGISCLSIERQSASDTQTSNILMEYAVDCTLQNVESKFCNFAHIDLRNSAQNTVQNCYVHESFAYGENGEGYGIVLQQTASQNLVENNILEHLRHAVLLQAGPSGNVVAYNYALRSFWVDPFFPDDASGDLVLHGNYPYANLLEGNVVQNMVVDDTHAFNGAENTFFRNRAENYGLFTAFITPTDSLILIGNEITNTNINPANTWFINGQDHFQYANNVQGTLTPTGTTPLSPVSFYKNEKPAFFENLSFPPIGYPNELDEHRIPAQLRYENGQVTACLQVVATDNPNEAINVTIFPNPSTGKLNIKTNLEILELQVFDTAGQPILTSKNNYLMLEKGIYFVKIRTLEGVVVRKVMVGF